MLLRSIALLALSISACGGVAASSSGVPGGDPASDAGRGDGGATSDAGLRVPLDHRPSPVACAPAPVPPEPVIVDAGLGPSAVITCRVHADCTAKPRGRCLYSVTLPPIEPGGTRCVYDECTTDDTCPAGATCTCDTRANVCTQGTCRVDADCEGGKGFCSPGVGGCGAFDGYYCHTPTDACVDDRDCANSNEKCIPMNGGWQCQPVGCASAGG